MFQVKIRNLFITIFLYALIGFSIIIGYSEIKLNYSYTLNKELKNTFTKTLSELLALDEDNSLIYSILITIYMILKSITVAIFVYDYRVFKKMNKDKHIKYGSTQLFLSYINVLTILIHMWGMLYIVFVKVTEEHKSHVIVASLTFGNAIISSFVLFARRFLVHRVEESFFFLSLNMFYLMVLVLVGILFLYFKEGYLEWTFIYLLIFENLFLAHDYYESTIELDLHFKEK